jgi:uncharacterized protein (TIGR02284 family)
MAIINEEVVKLQQGLIQTCKDGEEGYRLAARAIKQAEVKHLFESYANQRALFATVLQAEVQRLGGKPPTGGTITGMLYRGWLNIKNLVADPDEAAIFAECERSDETALKAYEEALQNELPPEVRSVVLRQAEQLKEAYQHVHALEVVAATP